MKTLFTDSKTMWEIDINVGSIKRVLAMTGHNLSLPHEADAAGITLADRLIRDTLLQIDVIWALLGPQAESRSMDVDKFCEAFKPEIMAKAEEALLDEWRNFFQKLGRIPTAEAIQKSQEMSKEMEIRGGQQLSRLQDAQLRTVTKVMTMEVDKVLAEAEKLTAGPSSENATDSPESSELATSTDARGEA
jgi:hypothetical protein